MPRCRSCNAEITWVRTAAGRSIPLDLDPLDDGNITVSDGVAIVFGSARVMPANVTGPRYVSHFVTCPQAGEHRRKR